MGLIYLGLTTGFRPMSVCPTVCVQSHLQHSVPNRVENRNLRSRTELSFTLISCQPPSDVSWLATNRDQQENFNFIYVKNRQASKYVLLTMILSHNVELMCTLGNLKWQLSSLLSAANL